MSGIVNNLFKKPIDYLANRVLPDFGQKPRTTLTVVQPSAPISVGAEAGGRNSSINAPSMERSRSDAYNAWGGGPESIALDPLGRRGAGGAGRTTLLGR